MCDSVHGMSITLYNKKSLNTVISQFNVHIIRYYAYRDSRLSPFTVISFITYKPVHC